MGCAQTAPLNEFELQSFFSTNEWGKKHAGETRRRTGGKGLKLPSGILLSKVGHCWSQNSIHSLTSTSAKWIADLTGVNCLLISQSVCLITLVSSLASSRSAPLSSNFRAMVFSFASMSCSRELKSSFTSLVCCTSLSLACTWSGYQKHTQCLFNIPFWLFVSGREVTDRICVKKELQTTSNTELLWLCNRALTIRPHNTLEIHS